MQRKIIRLGSSTLVVSLPSKWAREHGIAPGTPIELEPAGPDLLLRSSGKAAPRETSISLSHEPESAVRTLITNAYRAGYDRIMVDFTSQRQFELLRIIIATRLVGFEIVRQEPSRCVVENITEPSPEQFDKILRKEFFALQEYVALTARRFAGEEVRGQLDDLSVTIQRYDNFCRRVIVKERRDRSELLWTFLSILVHAQRELHHLHQYLDGARVHTTREQLALLKEVGVAFSILEKCAVEKDASSLAQLHTMQQKVFAGEGYKLLRAKGNDPVVTMHLLQALRQAYLANSPLTGLLA